MVDVNEAAKRARRTPETIRRWVWTGRVKAVKQGNKLFLPLSDIEPADVAVPGGGEPTAWSSWLRRAGEHQHLQPEVRSSADLVLADRDARAGR